MVEVRFRRRTRLSAVGPGGLRETSRLTKADVRVISGVSSATAKRRRRGAHHHNASGPKGQINNNAARGKSKTKGLCMGELEGKKLCSCSHRYDRRQASRSASGTRANANARRISPSCPLFKLTAPSAIRTPLLICRQKRKKKSDEVIGRSAHGTRAKQRAPAQPLHARHGARPRSRFRNVGAERERKCV